MEETHLLRGDVGLEKRFNSIGYNGRDNIVNVVIEINWVKMIKVFSVVYLRNCGEEGDIEILENMTFLSRIL